MVVSLFQDTLHSEVLLKMFSHKKKLNNILDGEFRVTNWNAVNELQGAPKSMKFRALVNVHNSVSRRWPDPNRIIQKASQSAKNNFEYRKSTTQPLARQKISFSRDHCLLKSKIKHFLSPFHHL